LYKLYDSYLGSQVYTPEIQANFDIVPFGSAQSGIAIGFSGGMMRELWKTKNQFVNRRPYKYWDVPGHDTHPNNRNPSPYDFNVKSSLQKTFADLNDIANSNFIKFSAKTQTLDQFLSDLIAARRNLGSFQGTLYAREDAMIKRFLAHITERSWISDGINILSDGSVVKIEALAAGWDSGAFLGYAWRKAGDGVQESADGTPKILWAPSPADKMSYLRHIKASQPGAPINEVIGTEEVLLSKNEKIVMEITWARAVTWARLTGNALDFQIFCKSLGQHWQTWGLGDLIEDTTNKPDNALRFASDIARSFGFEVLKYERKLEDGTLVEYSVDDYIDATNYNDPNAIPTSEFILSGKDANHVSRTNKLFFLSQQYSKAQFLSKTCRHTEVFNVEIDKFWEHWTVVKSWIAALHSFDSEFFNVEQIGAFFDWKLTVNTLIFANAWYEVYLKGYEKVGDYLNDEHIQEIFEDYTNDNTIVYNHFICALMYHFWHAHEHINGINL
jgi:hypothetical protein